MTDYTIALTGVIDKGRSPLPGVQPHPEAGMETLQLWNDSHELSVLHVHILYELDL